MSTDRFDQLKRLLGRAGWCCEICGAPVDLGSAQLAHRIPQRKHLVKRYGTYIIHHPENLRVACSELCNSRASVGESRQAHQDVISEIVDTHEEFYG